MQHGQDRWGRGLVPFEFKRFIVGARLTFRLFVVGLITLLWHAAMASALDANDEPSAAIPAAVEKSEPTAAEPAAHVAEPAAQGKESPAGGHAHDTTDIGHGNGTDQLGTPAALPFDLAVATFVVFICLMALLTKFAWGPISTALDQREQHIAEMISTAEKNAHASESRMKELEAQLAAQAEGVRDVINQARREGDSQKEKIIAEARSAAQREKEKAIEEIRSAKNLALREIAQKSVNTAVDLAKNIIHREVKPADHAKLIEDSLAQFHSKN